MIADRPDAVFSGRVVPSITVADDAGALLVRSGLVSSNALDDARARVANVGGTLGEQLVTSGVITDDELTDFYRARLLVPQVNPNTLARLTPKVVASIPSDMAIELRAIPVSLDPDNNLTVAMSDPSDRHAVDEIAFYTGAYIVRAVATQMQIAWCLAHYYGHVTALGQRLLHASESPIKAAISAVAAQRAPRTRGATGQVNAARHRAIAPITRPVDIARPSGAVLDGERIPAPRATPVSGPITTPLPGSNRMPAVVPSSGPIAVPRATPDAPTLPPRAAAAEVEHTPVIDPPPPVDATPVDATPADATPADATPADATPADADDRPRARSISGEIRVPSRRAPSIRPPMPEPLEPAGDDHDDDEPMIVIEGEASAPTPARHDDEATGPRKLPPLRRRRAVKSDPPELYARAGEVDLKTGIDRPVDDEPRIVIDEDALSPPTERIDTRSIHARETLPPALAGTDTVSDGAVETLDDVDTGAVIVSRPVEISEPVLLDRPRNTPLPMRAATPPPVRATAAGLAVGPLPKPDLSETDDDDTGEIVLLAPKIKPRSRPERKTQLGVTPAPATTGPIPVIRLHRDTETTGVPAMLDAAADVADRTIEVVRLPDDHEPDLEVDTGERPGARAAELTSELDDAIPERPPAAEPAPPARRRIDYDPVDDGWGPPGTTIPPPLLGAIPGSEDEDDDAPSVIPMSNIDSSPLLVGPPTPSVNGDSTGHALVRALEQATARAIEVIRQLEHAQTRDDVVATMVAHLAETHHRAGFFVTRPGPAKGTTELSLFSMKPRPPVLPFATLRLDRPSTLQDVVGTRLPYRGPMHDDDSRGFLVTVLGACPAEILLVPVTVRERVVGVLFGEHRQRHTFEEQLALAARAAGMALERIMKTKRP
jgi:hypothetical protein